jgi:enamine deaminase RidA (YjgF/YER057c/UK114 family)
MERSEFIVTPGFGDTLRNDLHFSTAVRIRNRVETSGQGGWNDDLEITAAIEDEIAAAFDIITVVLAQAGASWPQVIHVYTYHVGGFPTVVNETIVRLDRHHMAGHALIWTQLGVEALGHPAMRFEMRVTAIADYIHCSRPGERKSKSWSGRMSGCKQEPARSALAQQLPRRSTFANPLEPSCERQARVPTG